MITFNLSDCSGLTPDPGKVKLFRIQEMAPFLWKYLIEEKHNKRIYRQWCTLDITDDALGGSLQALNPHHVRDLLFKCNYRKITLKPEDRFHFTEAEHSFPMDYGYAMVWACYIARKGTLPSENEYVDFWFFLNAESFADNLTFRWESPQSKLGPITCAAYAKEALKNYQGYVGGKPAFSESEIFERIQRGAVHRAKKFYAAALREMCALYELVADDYEDMPPPPTIWWHPIMDVVFKADGIGFGNGERARAMAIAIYLDSLRSDAHIQRKAQHEHFTEMHEMPITMSGPKDEVFLPQEKDIARTRKALDTGRPRRRSYDAAKKG